VITKIIEAHERMAPKIVVPTKDGRKGHPVLLDASLRDEILQMDLAEGLRRVVNIHTESVFEVEVSSGTVLEDCDRPEDYERIIKGLEADNSIR